MINEIVNKIICTEDCRLLDKEEIHKIESVKYYEHVIEVNTQVSLRTGLREFTLYIGIPDPLITLPKIFIKKESYEGIKFIPHINKELNICVYDEGMNSVFNETSLPEIVEEMIYRAKVIIAQGEDLKTVNEEFEREFKAYWEITYDKNDIVSEAGLSLITNSTLPYKGLHFNGQLNGFRYLIYQESVLFEKFRKYLESRNVQYSDILVFEVEYLNRRPPFHLTFQESTKYIKKSDIKSLKQTINSNGTQAALIVFKNNLSEHFGWIYTRPIPPLNIMNGWHRKLSSWEVLTSSTFKKSLVERLTFSELSPERLEKRTSGIYIENKSSVCMIGLGSVGSNLLNLVIKMPINRFHLIDSDILQLENIYRHQYGFDKIGMAKVDAAKDNIINKDPFCEVVTNKCSILDILSTNKTILNENEVNILAVGNTMLEAYLLEHLIKTQCTKPLIIIWVEPFMASGQMLYIRPDDYAKAITLIKKYPNHVLNDSNGFKIYLKEGTCQSGYFPYSESNLTLFLSAIFPYLYKIINLNQLSQSKVISWIGDKDFVKMQGLGFSEFGEKSNSFQTIERNL